MILNKAKDPSSEELRAMARHRGFKLMRLRKRTVGVGDFGKYGLMDGDGQALLGVGADGFTATATEIADFLRGGIRQSWHLSAKASPKRRIASPAKKGGKSGAIKRKAAPRKDAPPSRAIPSIAS